MDLNILPKEIISKIFLYLECPVAKLIKNELQIYETDHNWDYTKMYRLYYVKSFMDFSCYYFDKYMSPYDFKSYHDRFSEDTFMSDE